MMIYLLVLLYILACVYRFDIKGKTANKEICYNALLIVLTLVTGLRYRLGADTTSYLHEFYNSIPNLCNITYDDLEPMSEPLWMLLNSIVLSLGGKWFIVQLIQASIVNGLLFRYIRKHSEYIFTCIFFYFISMYTYYTMEEMRASISIVVCLYAYDYFLDKKWAKGYMLMLIGCFFHKSTYPLLVTPLLMPLLKSNIVSAVLFAAVFAVSYIIKSELSEYVGLIDIADKEINNKIVGYASSDIYGEQAGTVNSKIVRCFPYLFYPLLSWYYNRKESTELIKLKPLVVLGLAFVIMRWNVEIAYRYIHFYACYLIIYSAQLFVDLVNQKKVLTIKCNRNTSLSFAVVLFIPFVFLTILSYKPLYVRYYPYSSIIDRSMTQERFAMYAEEGRPRSYFNQY